MDRELNFVDQAVCPIVTRRTHRAEAPGDTAREFLYSASDRSGHRGTKMSPQRYEASFGAGFGY